MSLPCLRSAFLNSGVHLLLDTAMKGAPMIAGSKCSYAIFINIDITYSAWGAKYFSFHEGVFAEKIEKRCIRV